jgi:signal transduction histidine kinase
MLKVKKVLFILPEAKLVFDGTEKLEEFTEKLAPVWTAAMESGELPILDYDQIVFFLEDKDLPTPKRQALLEAKKFCQKHKLAMLVPIILEKKLIGLLGLGEKRSGDMFSRDDFNLLKTFSYQAAVAIEKAQLYEQVKNYSEKLEEKVKQRTAKIKGLQEEQKQMMLEIAHGLQTPLTIIKGELNFLKEVVKDKDKIKSLERTIDRTSKFIYDMLRLARLESGAQEFKKEKINLSQLLIDLTEEFKIITEERGIKIISQLEPNLYIFGNMSALEEMITNLVSNSVKYIKEDGEKKIFIYLRKQNKKAEIIIQDTGIGINKEDLFRLFERFYRTRDGRGNTKRGTGLGLAISKRIVEIHRGEIKIKSKINKGTKFVINFPLV